MIRSSAAVLLLVVLLSGIGLYLVTEIGKAVSLPSFSTQSRTALDFVWFTVADGALTMVLVQLCRLLVPIRGHFHRSVLHKWFGLAVQVEGYSSGPVHAWADVMERVGLTSQQLSAADAVSQFEKYSLERSARDLWLNPSVPPMYDLPLEQLCAQVNSAAEAALEKPDESPQFLLCLVGIEGAPQLLELLPKGPSGPPTSDSQAAVPPADSPSRDSLAAAQARGVLVRLIQRRIDAFHIAAGAAWRRKLRTAVVAVGVVLGLLLALSGMSSAWSVSQVVYGLYGIIGGALGGFVAMVFRDLTAIVELKRRQP